MMLPIQCLSRCCCLEASKSQQTHTHAHMDTMRVCNGIYTIHSHSARIRTQCDTNTTQTENARTLIQLAHAYDSHTDALTRYTRFPVGTWYTRTHTMTQGVRTSTFKAPRFLHTFRMDLYQFCQFTPYEMCV